MVTMQSVLLSEMMGPMVDPSNSPGAKSPAGPTGTDQVLALLLLLTETESIETGTRSKWFAGINTVNKGQSPASWGAMAALSLPGTRGLSLGPTSAPQTSQ